MKKIIVTIFAWLISPLVLSEIIEIEAGKFTLLQLSKTYDEVRLKILSIKDTDEVYPPTTKIDFYRSDGSIGYSVGITKLDGKQGITAFFSMGNPSSPTRQGALVSNLKLDQFYKMSYSYIEENRLNIDVCGRKFSMDIGFEPAKVTYMISGMELEIESEP